MPQQQLQHLVCWSDGCAGQVKGCPAVLLHRQLAYQLVYQLGVPLMWCYGATAHFKGRHDSKGGAVKRCLARAIQTGQSASNMLYRASQLQECASQHLATSASQQEPSAAHQDRTPVRERSFLLLESAQVEAALSDPGCSQLEEQLLISGLPTGIRSWHQNSLFSSKREC
eukprot:1149923-Pelagomonas_calceolata.AAC.7